MIYAEPVTYAWLIVLTTSLAKKGPWAVHITLCSDGGGRIFVTSLHFTTKSAHIYVITTYTNRILQANTPAQYKLILI